MNNLGKSTTPTPQKFRADSFNDMNQLCLRLLAPTMKDNQLDFDRSVPTFATGEQTSAEFDVRFHFIAAILELQNKAHFYFFYNLFVIQ
jgi:hypothetical protein